MVKIEIRINGLCIEEGNEMPTKKYPREWEFIFCKEAKYLVASVDRLKVFGGWIVRNGDLCINHQSHIVSSATSMVFMSDPNHEWELEEVDD